MNNKKLKFGDKVEIVNSLSMFNGKTGMFVDNYAGYSRVYIHPSNGFGKGRYWTDVYWFNPQDVIKLTGQLLFDFMY